MRRHSVSADSHLARLDVEFRQTGSKHLAQLVGDQLAEEIQGAVDLAGLIRLVQSRV